MDADLNEVIRAWARMPGAVRSALVAMARAGVAVGNLPSPNGGGAGGSTIPQVKEME